MVAYVDHGDHVVKLPPDVNRWLTSDYCHFQGMMGHNIISTQFHVEFNSVYIKYLWKICGETLSEEQLLQLESKNHLNNGDCYFW
jgi:GMP synthase-like glutamine amidotransferase